MTLAALSCAGVPSLPGSVEALAPLWTPPAPLVESTSLRIEPVRSASRLDEPAVLSVRGAVAKNARCSWPGGAGEGPTLRIPFPEHPGVVLVRCVAGDTRAEAQVTFTAARTLPVVDPYAGGVVLFKLRRSPERPLGPGGTRDLGFPSLDARLRHLGAYALPAFPLDLSAMQDRVGLTRWLAIDLPAGVNFYQAVSLLREDPALYPESYLPEDGEFLRVAERTGWPHAFAVPEPAATRPQPARPRATPARRWKPVKPGALPWELRAVGVPEVWQRQRGSGVTLAVIDTGVDVNHVAVASSLRLKAGEAPDVDADGNGVPGDEAGANFAHLAIARGSGAPWLALGLVSDLSDWDGSASGRDVTRWGHGTAVAALATGSAVAGGRPGVAPEATLLAVDVQENLRTNPSHLVDEDPRMRLFAGAATGALRSSVWARALGIAYAVGEGARVLSCAWSASDAHWILHDVLLYAEDNCALAVCAVREDTGGARLQPAPGYPAGWHPRRQRATQAGSGSVLDVWTGREIPDFFRRPLRGMVLVGKLAPGMLPDLFVDSLAEDSPPVRSAVSNPRNDSAPLPDHRTASYTGTAVVVGLVAGGAALASAERPDLEPWALREALIAGARERQLWLPGALAALAKQQLGSCTHLLEQRRQPREVAGPWWRRTRIRTSVKHRTESPWPDGLDPFPVPAKPEDPH